MSIFLGIFRFVRILVVIWAIVERFKNNKKRKIMAIIYKSVPEFKQEEYDDYEDLCIKINNALNKLILSGVFLIIWTTFIYRN